VALSIAFAVVYTSVAGDTPDGKVAEVRYLDKESSSLLIAAVLQGLAAALMAIPLGFLYLATRYRRPEIPTRLRALIIGAPLVFCGLFIARQVLVNAETADLVPDLAGLPNKQAEDLIDDRLGNTTIGVFVGLTFAAQIAVGAAIGLTANQARRAGLMSNFIGILGIIVAILFVIPLLGALPVVQLFWFVALAALFLGRWPGGRGPAWETGEAEPWPTMQQVQEQRAAEAPEPEPEPEPEPDEEPAPAGPNHPRSKKRKKKRRR
jgi:hypothetical protein